MCVATSNRTKGQFKQSFYEWPAQKSAVVSFIETRSKDHNVWFGVNLLRESERVKINCLPSSLVWADLDFVNPDNITPPPTCVIESSPSRYQAYWRLEDEVPADVAELYSKRIAYSTGADKSGWPLTKLLRVPHTLNFKYETPQEVKVLKAFETRVPLEVFEEVADPPLEGVDQEQWDTLTAGTDTPDVDTLPNPQTIIQYLR